VTLHARTFVRSRALPLENLATHLKMQNALLMLDPLDFGFAGGHLQGVISLDGRQQPIQAHARIGAHKIRLSELFPSIDLAQSSRGQLNGEFDLRGAGDSVDHMLATADGRIALVVAEGEISKLMEKTGLNLLEILHLKMTGDKTIKLRCAVADFAVKGGVMAVNALIIDTDVSTLIGRGSINLDQERLDLTLTPNTRATSLIALRGPIYSKGTFSQPKVKLDKGRIAMRSAGALVLGLINPLYALLPLVEMGPGRDSECGKLIEATLNPLPKPKSQNVIG